MGQPDRELKDAISLEAWLVDEICRLNGEVDKKRDMLARVIERKQELIDTGQLPGLSRTEQAELAAANKRIRELETEVAILKRARELLREPHDPKGGTRP